MSLQGGSGGFPRWPLCGPWGITEQDRTGTSPEGHFPGTLWQPMGTEAGLLAEWSLQGPRLSPRGARACSLDIAHLWTQVYGDKDADGFYRGETCARLGLIPCNMVSEIQADDEEMVEQLLRQGFLPLSTPVDKPGEAWRGVGGPEGGVGMGPRAAPEVRFCPVTGREKQRRPETLGVHAEDGGLV